MYVCVYLCVCKDFFTDMKDIDQDLVHLTFVSRSLIMIHPVFDLFLGIFDLLQVQIVIRVHLVIGVKKVQSHV